MIDSRTSIRPFLDLQHDLRCVVNGVKALESTIPVVTFRWSDGSTNKTPTFNMVRDFVGKIFKDIVVGNIPLSGMDSTILRIDGALSAHISAYSANEATIRRCRIGDLTSGIVVLGDSVQIVGLTATGELKTQAFTTEEYHALNLEVNTLGPATMDTTMGVHWITNNMRSSRLFNRTPDDSYAALANGVFRNILVIDGPMQTYRQVRLTYTELAVKVPFVYAGTTADASQWTTTSFQLGTWGIPETTYNTDSPVSMALLYPYKNFNTGLDTTRATLEYLLPRDDDNYRVVTVHNVSGTPVKANNVWVFLSGREPKYQKPYATLNAMSEVTIPAYSTIDFIFSFTVIPFDRNKNVGTLCAYMLPTKAL